MMLSVILQSMLMKPLFYTCNQTTDLWQQLELASEIECDLQDRKFKWLVGFNNGKTELVLFDLSNKTGATDAKVDEFILEERSSLKMLGFSFFSILNWGSYIISIIKTVSKKIGPLICFMKFLSPEVAFYLYKSTIQPCMEYYCHV